MDEHVYLLTIGLPLATVLLVFGMRYFSAVQQARLRFAHEESYRVVAEKAATAQAETATALASINATLSELKARVAAVEKVLKEVE